MDEFNFEDVVKRTVPRYTLPAWQKLGLGDDFDWEIKMCPHKMYDFVLQAESKEAEKLGRAAPFVLKVVVIDEEFFQWADKHHLKYDEKNVLKYINTVDDENAIRLLAKNHMNIERVYGNLLIFANVPEETEMMETRLSEDTVRKIKNVLENEYGFYEKLTVPGIVVLADELFDCFLEEEDYDGKNNVFDKEQWSVKNIKGLDRPVPLFIPFMIDAYIEGCECSVFMEMLEYNANKDFLEDTETDEEFSRASAEFNKGPMALAIKKDLNLDDFYIVPEGIDYVSAEDFVKDFLEEVYSDEYLDG